MGKSYKDLNKQPKKNNPSKVLRSEYEEREGLEEVEKYKNCSFLLVKQEESD